MSIFLFTVILLISVYTDAKILKERDDVLYRQVMKHAPIRWFFLTLLLSILVLPFYLLLRKKFYAAGKEKLGISESMINPQLQWISDATGIYITWYFLLVLAIFAIEAIDSILPIFHTKLNELIASSALYSLIMTYLIYHVTRQDPYPGFLTTVGLRKNHQPFFKIVIAPIIAGVILSVIVAFIMFARRVVPSTPLSETLASENSPLTFICFFIMALLVAPLLEELIFRGYLYSLIMKLKGKMAAFVSVSLIFAFLHVGQYWGDWVAIVIVVILGFSLTGLRAWSGSTITSVVAHYTYNILITIIPMGILIISNPPFFTYSMFYQQLDSQTKERLLTESIKRYPKDIEAYNDLAWLYAEENRRLAAALYLVNQALIKDPDNSTFRDTKAEIFYRMGKYDEAVRIERKLVEENPLDPIFKKQLKKFRQRLNQNKILEGTEV